MRKIYNLQDQVLDKLQEEHQVVTVFTTNGYQMKGRITGFDRFMVTLENKDAQFFVFKSAISTIQPDRPVNLDGLG